MTILYFSKWHDSFLHEAHYISGSIICEISASVVFCKIVRVLHHRERNVKFWLKALVQSRFLNLPSKQIFEQNLTQFIELYCVPSNRCENSMTFFICILISIRLNWMFETNWIDWITIIMEMTQISEL